MGHSKINVRGQSPVQVDVNPFLQKEGLHATGWGISCFHLDVEEEAEPLLGSSRAPVPLLTLYSYADVSFTPDPTHVVQNWPLSH